MQILLSEAANARVGERLRALSPGLSIALLHGDGSLSRDGDKVSEDQIAPEAVWASLDVFTGGQLGRMLGLVIRAPTVRWVQSFAAGVESPVFKTLVGAGVRLCKGSAQAPAIAEYVLCNALSLIHPIARYEEDKAERRWRPTGFREVASTRWTLVGYGSIGREIAARLRPFNARLTVVRRSVTDVALADDVRPAADLPELASGSDVVVLACALNAQTQGIAGEAFFQALKPGAIFINIGRGGLVDEEALRRGLERDQPATAVLDVFETEPLPETSWMWEHPKVRISPHRSGGGDGVLGRGDRLFLENLARYLRKEVLLHEAQPWEVGL